MPLPNLFVIGAPKCGTTSLHGYLDEHPRISMSSVKEPKYFLADGTRPHPVGPGDARAVQSYVVERAAYEALFHYPEDGSHPTDGSHPEGPSYAGESTPFYLWHPDALARIHELVPDARLIAVLREPVMRAYSNWSDLREQDREKLDFTSALAAEEERRRRGWEPFWFYRSLGLYGEQLRRAYSVFPRAQVKVLFTEDLARDPRRAVDDVLSFLDLEPLAGALSVERMNETTYGPVNRRGRAAQTVFAQASRARRVVPPRLRAVARRAVRRRLRSDATSDAHRAALRRRFLPLFADDLAVLGGLGVDAARWDHVTSSPR
jgi:hypothetical protein